MMPVRIFDRIIHLNGKMKWERAISECGGIEKLQLTRNRHRQRVAVMIEDLRYIDARIDGFSA